jgi:hypothetical protein
MISDRAVVSWQSNYKFSRFSRLSLKIDPPPCCLTMISCAVENPRPFRSSVGLVVKKGLEIFFSLSVKFRCDYHECSFRWFFEAF